MLFRSTHTHTHTDRVADLHPAPESQHSPGDSAFLFLSPQGRPCVRRAAAARPRRSCVVTPLSPSGAKSAWRTENAEAGLFPLSSSLPSSLFSSRPCSLLSSYSSSSLSLFPPLLSPISPSEQRSGGQGAGGRQMSRPRLRGIYDTHSRKGGEGASCVNSREEDGGCEGKTCLERQMG